MAQWRPIHALDDTYPDHAAAACKALLRRRLDEVIATGADGDLPPAAVRMYAHGHEIVDVHIAQTPPSTPYYPNAETRRHTRHILLVQFSLHIRAPRLQFWEDMREWHRETFGSMYRSLFLAWLRTYRDTAMLRGAYAGITGRALPPCLSDVHLYALFRALRRHTAAPVQRGCTVS